MLRVSQEYEMNKDKCYSQKMRLEIYYRLLLYSVYRNWDIVEGGIIPAYPLADIDPNQERYIEDTNEVN
jgi:hypothetical protein